MNCDDDLRSDLGVVVICYTKAGLADEEKQEMQAKMEAATIATATATTTTTTAVKVTGIKGQQESEESGHSSEEDDELGEGLQGKMKSKQGVEVRILIHLFIVRAN